MRESIRVIKLCVIVSLVSLLLTYIVTVNLEGHFIEINSIWISNNFFVTLFGGVFASMLVVVICEIQKYNIAKATTENFLFYHGLSLYQTLMQMKTFIEDVNCYPEWNISKTLFDESVRMAQIEINALQVTDYVTFKSGEGTLMFEHEMLRNESLQKIQPILQSNNRLKIAINKIEMDELKSQMVSHVYSQSRMQITSSTPMVACVLKEELERVTSAIAIINGYLSIIDNYCHKRYRWDEMRGKLVFQHLDSFINESAASAL